MSAVESRHRRCNPPSAAVPCRQQIRCQSSDLVPCCRAPSRHRHWSFRFDNGWILRRLNSNFIHVRMRQIFPPSVLPMLQHAKGLTTVVVRTQRLVSWSRPSCRFYGAFDLHDGRLLASYDGKTPNVASSPRRLSGPLRVVALGGPTEEKFDACAHE